MLTISHLPQSAQDLLSMLWQVTQFFDDVADGDEFNRRELDGALWNALVGIPSNPFYQANQSKLTPIIAVQILKWKASDDAELSGDADAMSYMWRAGFYDVVLSVCEICHGPEWALMNAQSVLRTYGETLDEYKGEFHA